MPNKKYIMHLSLYLLVISSIYYLAELARLCAPLFSFVYYATFNQMFVIIIKMIIYLLIIIFGLRYSQKYFYVEKERKDIQFPLKRHILIYVIVVLAILCVSAVLGFKVKPAVDIGENVTGPNWVTNLVKFLMQIIRMGVVVLFIRHAQELAENLFLNSKMKNIPIGGLLSLIVLGSGTLFIDGISKVNLLLLFYHLLYGSLYLLNYRYFSYTYVCCFLIQLL